MADFLTLNTADYGYIIKKTKNRYICREWFDDNEDFLRMTAKAVLYTPADVLVIGRPYIIEDEQLSKEEIDYIREVLPSWNKTKYVLFVTGDRRGNLIYTDTGEYAVDDEYREIMAKIPDEVLDSVKISHIKLCFEVEPYALCA